MQESFVVRYRFSCGPDVAVWEAPIVKTNCQAWVHYDLGSLGIVLPATMLSEEIYLDETTYFRTLKPGEAPRRGDVFQFGPPHLVDFKKLHCAVHSGVITRGTGEPLLTNANIVVGTVDAWPLSDFFRYERYGKLFAVKRPLGLAPS